MNTYAAMMLIASMGMIAIVVLVRMPTAKPKKEPEQPENPQELLIPKPTETLEPLSVTEMQQRICEPLLEKAYEGGVFRMIYVECALVSVGRKLHAVGTDEWGLLFGLNGLRIDDMPIEARQQLPIIIGKLLGLPPYYPKTMIKQTK